MTDWIIGEKFVDIADMVFYPEGVKDCNPLKNTFCPLCLKEMNVVYTHTLYVKQLFEKINRLNCKFIVITHNCDENVDETYKIPANVVRWFSQNVNVCHPKIESIPIGLENSKWFKSVSKKEKMEQKLSEPRSYKNLAYLNINVNTYPVERVPVFELFKDKQFVNVEKGINGQGFDFYIDNIYNHKFVICPRGNGLDTHRIWETLYLGSIPVVRKDINNWFYKSLPILYVNSWNDVTEDFLNSMWPEYSSANNKRMLEFEYWKNKILSYVSN